MSDDGKRKRRGGKTSRTKRRTNAQLRDALPNVPLPRHRQPTINPKETTAHLATAAEIADELEHDRAELGKAGSKLEEIVHMLNAGTDPASITNIIESALEQHQASVAKTKQTLDDLKEVSAKILGQARRYKNQKRKPL
jgi:hypothetical protein